MQVVNESLNPVWNQTFDFVVEDGLHDMLILEVWDHDTFGKVVFYQQFCTLGKLSSFFLFFFLNCIPFHCRITWEDVS